MIPIKFDPTEFLKTASLAFVSADLLKSNSLATRLRASTPLSQYLHSLLTPEAQQLITKYDGISEVSAALAEALLACLNQALNDPLFSERKRFAGIELQRDILIRGLRKLELAGESLVCLNRLLLEEAYPEELAKSSKAEWDGWSLLARAATRKVIGEWEDWKDRRAAWQAAPPTSRAQKPPKFEPSFEDETWKGFRNWLLDHVFHNKCAYCETPHVGFPGDAEHFRPKGRVRVRSENDDLEIVTIVDETSEKIEHPGYFWLAYHWQNLLPACETCNRGGKNDLFPVRYPHVAVKRLTVQEIDDLIHKMTESENEKNIFYLEPDDLDELEGRLLLHPYHDEPKKHIYFKTDGTVAAWQGSDQGTASITIYNLNAEKTVKARQREQVSGHRDYTDMVLKAIPDLRKARESALTLKAEYYNGERPYAAAVFDFIHFYLDKSLVDPEILLNEPTATDSEQTSE